MRNLMILLIGILTYTCTLQAQVKDTFRDKENTSTIVVVKEDNAIDEKLLDEHFDLNNMSMNDQIMIMTVPEQTPTPEPLDIENATASTGNNIEIFFDDFDANEVEVETETAIESAEPAKEIVQEEKIVESKATKPVVNQVKKSTKRAASGTYQVKDGLSVKKATQKKYFGKKRKAKKRNKKRIFKRKSSNSCYNF